MANNVYRATDFEILPLNPDVSVQNPPNRVEAHLLALVRSHLCGGYFLYSYGWDLTRRLQAQWETLKDDAGKALWEVVSRAPPPQGLNTAQSYPPSRQMTVSSGTSMQETVATVELDLTDFFAGRFLQSRLIDVTYASGDQNVSVFRPV